MDLMFSKHPRFSQENLESCLRLWFYEAAYPLQRPTTISRNGSVMSLSLGYSVGEIVQRK